MCNGRDESRALKEVRDGNGEAGNELEVNSASWSPLGVILGRLFVPASVPPHGAHGENDQQAKENQDEDFGPGESGHRRLRVSEAIHTFGRRVCQSVADSYMRPARRSFSSAKGGARSCRPIGRPDFVKPQGMLR